MYIFCVSGGMNAPLLMEYIELWERYILRSTISSGSQGTVGLYLDIEENEIVAIKIIEKVKLCRSGKIWDNAQYRILIEMNAVNKIGEHNNVVKVKRYGEDDECFYIIMDYVSGEELFTRVEEGSVGESEARGIFLQLLSAVEHLHKCGVYHRDIKLENVIYNSDTGLVTLIDLGFCYVSECKRINHKENSTSNESETQLQASGSTGDVASVKSGESLPLEESKEEQEEEEYDDKIEAEFRLGTKEYASPEIILRMNYRGVPNDIWCLGVLLYSMVYQYYPFSSSRYDCMDILGHPIIDYIMKFDDNQDISDELKDLISKMLHNDYEKRISIKDIRLHPWMKLGS